MNFDLTEEEILAEQKERENISNKEAELSSKIKSLVSEYNKFAEENYLRKYIFYFRVNDLSEYCIPRSWNKDDETDIDDIYEFISRNPGWYSSSAKCY